MGWGRPPCCCAAAAAAASRACRRCCTLGRSALTRRRRSCASQPADAAAIEEWARGQSAITPDAAGDAQQQAMAKVAAAAAEVRAAAPAAACGCVGAGPGAQGGQGDALPPSASSTQSIHQPTNQSVPPHPSILPPLRQGKFLYTKFFAVGLFRLIELTGSKDPKSLTALVQALNLVSWQARRAACWRCMRCCTPRQGFAGARRPCLTTPSGPPTAAPSGPCAHRARPAPPARPACAPQSQERVNADLMTYKGVLSKLEAAKEIMKVRALPGGVCCLEPACGRPLPNAWRRVVPSACRAGWPRSWLPSAWLPTAGRSPRAASALAPPAGVPGAREEEARGARGREGGQGRQAGGDGVCRGGVSLSSGWMHQRLRLQPAFRGCRPGGSRLLPPPLHSCSCTAGPRSRAPRNAPVLKVLESHSQHPALA